MFLLAPTAAYAEPRPSGAHLPLLRLGLVVISLGLCVLVWRLLRRWIGKRRHAWVYWLIAAVLALLVLAFLGPLVMAVGSIVLTGRTM